MTQDSLSTGDISSSPDMLPAMERLQRLEKYLEVDPNNLSLLGEAFEAALQCAQWPRANFHLRHGQALPGSHPSWALKEGDFWLAQGYYDQAREVLESLRNLPNPPEEFAVVVLHNLAYVDLRQGLFSSCVDRIAVHMERQIEGNRVASILDGEQVSLAEQLLQQLWLRALHRTAALERAYAWTKQAEDRKCLDAHAAGIASLIAIDISDLSSARRWADLAFSDKGARGRPTPPLEAFITRATLALSQRQAAAAVDWADKALTISPRDGRAWSARAFALLLDGKLDLARRDFSSALVAMPGHIGTWHGQGWTELLMRDLDAADKSFRKALELDRNFAESHGGLAVVLALKKSTELARESAERALRIDRTNLSGRYAQAILDGSVEDTDAIRKLAHRLLSSRDSATGQRLSEMIDGLL